MELLSFILFFGIGAFLLWLSQNKESHVFGLFSGLFLLLLSISIFVTGLAPITGIDSNTTYTYVDPSETGINATINFTTTATRIVYAGSYANDIGTNALAIFLIGIAIYVIYANGIAFSDSRKKGKLY